MSTTEEARVLPEVVMNDALAQAIQSAVSSADVKSLLIAEAERQLTAKTVLDESQAAAEKAAADKVIADKAAEDAAAATAAAAAQIFARDEVIGGRTFHFEAASDGELDRQILNAYKVAYAVREPDAAATVVDPAETARAVEAEVLAKTELERKFRLGEISAAEYIDQSGAMHAFLEKEGISIAALKETVDENKGKKFAQSWAQAADEFKQSPGGSDWPGGDKNQELIGLQIAALGLVDADDKVAALSQAYAEMKRTGLYFPQGDVTTAASNTATPVTPAAPIVANDAAVAAQAAALAARTAAQTRVASISSSIFGASSGTSGAPVTSPAVTAAKAVVPADATPQEIMQAFNEAQIAAGIDPNAAFRQISHAKAI